MVGADVAVKLDPGGLRLEWPGLATCLDLIACCRLREGAELRSTAWRQTEEPEQFLAECGPLLLRLALHQDATGVALGVNVELCTPADVVEVGLATRPQIDGEEPAWVLYSGYQSWDPAGNVAARGLTSTGRPLTRESWWTIGLAGDHGRGLAAVAQRAHSCCTRFAFSAGELKVLWCQPEGLRRDPTLFEGPAGTRWESEMVCLDARPDVRQALIPPGPGNLPAEVPRGWLTWYQLGPWVSREDVVANASLLATAGWRELAYRYIQIDDGWQEAYGDWHPNSKFRSGLSGLAQELGEHGKMLGVWTAPFLVSASADLAASAPADWFLIDPATKERAVDPRHQVFGPMYILDGRHPGVQAHLRDTFAVLYQEGIRYFKIDFLYAAGYEGTDALRQGLAAIREGCRDAYVLACGAPLLPMVGLVDGCRVGPDTATPLYDFEAGRSKPTIFGDEVIAVARNFAARHFMRTWFQLDPDVALVGGNLTLEQGRQLVTVATLAGGPFFASDDLVSLPAERLNLLSNPEVLGLVGGPPAVPDWEPHEADLPPTHWRRGDVLAVFNWSGEERQIRVRAPGAERARDLWARRDLPEFADGVSLRIAAHDVRLLKIVGTL